MLKAREEGPWRKIIFSWPTAVILLIAIGFLSQSVFSLYVRERTTAQLLNDRRVELADVENRAAIIEGKLHELETSRGIEEEVRSRYEVAKPGENLIIIVDREGTSSGGEVTRLSFWKRMRAFLGF